MNIIVEKVINYSYRGYAHRDDLTPAQLQVLGDIGTDYFSVEGEFHVNSEFDVYVDSAYIVSNVDSKIDVAVTDQEADYDDLAQQIEDLGDKERWADDKLGEADDAAYDSYRDNHE